MGSQHGLLSRGVASRGRVALQARRGHWGSLQLGGGSATCPQQGKLRPAGSQLAPQDNNLNLQGSDPVWQANHGGRATKQLLAKPTGTRSHASSCQARAHHSAGLGAWQRRGWRGGQPPPGSWVAYCGSPPRGRTRNPLARVGHRGPLLCLAPKLRRGAGPGSTKRPACWNRLWTTNGSRRLPAHWSRR